MSLYALGHTLYNNMLISNQLIFSKKFTEDCDEFKWINISSKYNVLCQILNYFLLIIRLLIIIINY